MIPDLNLVSLQSFPNKFRLPLVGPMNEMSLPLSLTIGRIRHVMVQ